MLEIIENRRSIRKYKDQEVEKYVIEKIIYYGTLAPSAHNKQPWEFVIINKDKNIKNKIADALIEQVEKLDASKGIIHTANIIKESPVMILVFNKYGDNHLIDNTQSIAACIQNMILAATELGLGTLWVRHICLIEEDICRQFYKTNLQAALLLGYTEEAPEKRHRNSVAEVTEWF